MKLLMKLVLLGAAALGTEAQAQDLGLTDRVTLTIAPQKATYLELEPVRLAVKVENRTGKDLTIPLDPFDSTVLTIRVAASSGEFVPYHPVGLPWGSPNPGSKVLKSGQS